MTHDRLLRIHLKLMKPADFLFQFKCVDISEAVRFNGQLIQIVVDPRKRSGKITDFLSREYFRLVAGKQEPDQSSFCQTRFFCFIFQRAGFFTPVK